MAYGATNAEPRVYLVAFRSEGATTLEEAPCMSRCPRTGIPVIIAVASASIFFICIIFTAISMRARGCWDPESSEKRAVCRSDRYFMVSLAGDVVAVLGSILALSVYCYKTYRCNRIPDQYEFIP